MATFLSFVFNNLHYRYEKDGGGEKGVSWSICTRFNFKYGIGDVYTVVYCIKNAVKQLSL